MFRFFRWIVRPSPGGTTSAGPGTVAGPSMVVKLPSVSSAYPHSGTTRPSGIVALTVSARSQNSAARAPAGAPRRSRRPAARAATPGTVSSILLIIACSSRLRGS